MDAQEKSNTLTLAEWGAYEPDFAEVEDLFGGWVAPEDIAAAGGLEEAVDAQFADLFGDWVAPENPVEADDRVAVWVSESSPARRKALLEWATTQETHLRVQMANLFNSRLADLGSTEVRGDIVPLEAPVHEFDEEEAPEPGAPTKYELAKARRRLLAWPQAAQDRLQEEAANRGLRLKRDLYTLVHQMDESIEADWLAMVAGHLEEYGPGVPTPVLGDEADLDDIEEAIADGAYEHELGDGAYAGVEGVPVNGDVEDPASLFEAQMGYLEQQLQWYRTFKRQVWATWQRAADGQPGAWLEASSEVITEEARVFEELGREVERRYTFDPGEEVQADADTSHFRAPPAGDRLAVTTREATASNLPFGLYKPFMESFVERYGVDFSPIPWQQFFAYEGKFAGDPSNRPDLIAQNLRMLAGNTGDARLADPRFVRAMVNSLYFEFAMEDNPTPRAEVERRVEAGGDEEAWDRYVDSIKFFTSGHRIAVPLGRRSLEDLRLRERVFDPIYNPHTQDLRRGRPGRWRDSALWELEASAADTRVQALRALNDQARWGRIQYRVEATTGTVPTTRKALRSLVERTPQAFTPGTDPLTALSQLYEAAAQGFGDYGLLKAARTGFGDMASNPTDSRRAAALEDPSTGEQVVLGEDKAGAFRWYWRATAKSRYASPPQDGDTFMGLVAPMVQRRAAHYAQAREALEAAEGRTTEGITVLPPALAPGTTREEFEAGRGYEPPALRPALLSPDGRPATRPWSTVPGPRTLLSLNRRRPNYHWQEASRVERIEQMELCLLLGQPFSGIAHWKEARKAAKRAHRPGPGDLREFLLRQARPVMGEDARAAMELELQQYSDATNTLTPPWPGPVSNKSGLRLGADRGTRLDVKEPRVVRGDMFASHDVDAMVVGVHLGTGRAGALALQAAQHNWGMWAPIDAHLREGEVHRAEGRVVGRGAIRGGRAFHQPHEWWDPQRGLVEVQRLNNRHLFVVPTRSAADDGIDSRWITQALSDLVRKVLAINGDTRDANGNTYVGPDSVDWWSPTRIKTLALPALGYGWRNGRSYLELDEGAARFKELARRVAGMLPGVQVLIYEPLDLAQHTELITRTQTLGRERRNEVPRTKVAKAARLGTYDHDYGVWLYRIIEVVDQDGDVLEEWQHTMSEEGYRYTLVRRFSKQHVTWTDVRTPEWGVDAGRQVVRTFDVQGAGIDYGAGGRPYARFPELIGRPERLDGWQRPDTIVAQVPAPERAGRVFTNIVDPEPYRGAPWYEEPDGPQCLERWGRSGYRVVDHDPRSLVLPATCRTTVDGEERPDGAPSPAPHTQVSVQLGAARVIHVRDVARMNLNADQYVHIHRGTRWADPDSSSNSSGETETSFEHWARWYRGEMKAGRITRQDLAALHGKFLVCYCAPNPCIGDYLVELAARAHDALATS